MKITFCGGAEEVTGSNYLLEAADGTRILIDCGMAQGSRYAEEENFKAFSYDPKKVAALFVTHAHIDHVGRIPKLMNDGFRGAIYSTPPTRDFAELLLMDSEHILAKEAEDDGHAPLYTIPDIEKVMQMWQGIEYHAVIEVPSADPKANGATTFTVEPFDAGHILGSAFYRITADGTTVIFSGDLGNSPAPLIHDLEALPAADYVTMESTYGGRVHAAAGTRETDLEATITETVKAGGVLMIPSFALERTQDLLFHLNDLMQRGLVPSVPVYMDSPLAIKLTSIYEKYHSYFNAASLGGAKTGADIFNFPNLHSCVTPEESKAINHAPSPKIIIAGSGMSNGGRILHHEMRYLSDPQSCLLIVGYQAAGTLGRRLQEGAKEVPIFGVQIEVRAKIKTVSAYSAHADQPHLLAWVAPRAKSIKKIFVVQGEADQSGALAAKLKEEFGVATKIPTPGEVVEL